MCTALRDIVQAIKLPAIIQVAYLYWPQNFEQNSAEGLFFLVLSDYSGLESLIFHLPY